MLFNGLDRIVQSFFVGISEFIYKPAESLGLSLLVLLLRDCVTAAPDSGTFKGCCDEAPQLTLLV